MYNSENRIFRYVNAANGALTFTRQEGFVINKPVGIDSVEISLKRAKGIGQVGETVQSRSVQPRPVNISGRIVGSGQEKERLMSVVHPDLPARLYADDYYLDVVPTSTPAIEPRRKFAYFEFSLLAAYPYWQREKMTVAVLSGLAYRFRLPCNFSKPYRFAENLHKKLVTVDNKGQLPVPYTLKLTAKGQCSKPAVTNATTGQSLRIDKDMSPGEVITVRITHGKTYAESSIDGDIRGAITLDSDFFRLEVGENVLKPEAASGLEQMDAEISFAPERVGIWL